ncbi:MAG TPA: CCA tRNA nucleotidyltransferase [Candidatus Paceibacterota bacterium]
MNQEAGKNGAEGEEQELAPQDVAGLRSFVFARGEKEGAKTLNVLDFKPLHEILPPEKFIGAERIISAFATPIKRTTKVGKEISRPAKLLICGGFVRDALLEQEPHDIDFATSATGEEAKALLRETFKDEIESGKVWMDMTGEQYGVLRVRFREIGEEYEIASFRQDSNEGDGRRPDSVTSVRFAGHDADRRDFTINSLFYDPNNGRVFDFTGGLDDIKEKRLRFVGEAGKRIEEDSLRMLRYTRFLAKTGFSSDPQACEAIRSRAERVKTLSPERLTGNTGELRKLFAEGKIGASLRTLKELNLLREIMPEVEALDSALQGPPYHMEGSVFEHTDILCDQLPKDAPFTLALAGIMHDIAKPECREEKIMDGKTKVSFIGHEEAGVEKARPILERLKISKAEQETILWLIKNHLRIAGFHELRKFNALELLAHPAFDQLLALREADTAAALADDPKIAAEHERVLTAIRERRDLLRKQVSEQSGPQEKLLKLINGPVFIGRFKEIRGGELEGPARGKLQKAFKQALIEGGVVEESVAREVLDKTIREFEL